MIASFPAMPTCFLEAGGSYLTRLVVLQNSFGSCCAAARPHSMRNYSVVWRLVISTFFYEPRVRNVCSFRGWIFRLLTCGLVLRNASGCAGCASAEILNWVELRKPCGSVQLR
mmetsp:Transcript_9869/g.27536  ORF Transcript_9869/g.27536 Transcript_9869/m.27536 type:complete len:113 (-) Transcript_9869:83-421(-)